MTQATSSPSDQPSKTAVIVGFKSKLPFKGRPPSEVLKDAIREEIERQT